MSTIAISTEKVKILCQEYLELIEKSIKESRESHIKNAMIRSFFNPFPPKTEADAIKKLQKSGIWWWEYSSTNDSARVIKDILKLCEIGDSDVINIDERVSGILSEFIKYKN